jgi:hypothetical protein
MSWYDCEETDLAVEIFCRKHGPFACQPNRSQSGQEGDKIVLRACGRVMARYPVDKLTSLLERRRERQLERQYRRGRPL